MAAHLDSGLKSPLDKPAARRAFERAAVGYDTVAVLQKEMATRLLERLDYVRLAPKTVLDLGAGTGLAIDALQRRYRQARVLALDFAFPMLRLARRRGSLLRRPHLPLRRRRGPAPGGGQHRLHLLQRHPPVVQRPGPHLCASCAASSPPAVCSCSPPSVPTPCASCGAPGPRPTVTAMSAPSSICTMSAMPWCAPVSRGR
jgi:hypothetical protein